MALFSQRKGIRPLTKAIQRDDIDDELRNSLWSALFEIIFKKWQPYAYTWTPDSREINGLIDQYWISYFKRPTDTQPHFGKALEFIRSYFFSCDWNDVYDFIEFTAKSAEAFAEEFCGVCNALLERESSAYRFVGHELTEITDDNEIASIEDALSGKNSAVTSHLNAALSLMSDRKRPDFRNSIKESISAVEAICRIIVKDPKATLGETLKKIDPKAAIHPAFSKALSGLYGFTSDGSGIRHALLEEPSLSYSDAKFMLVLCSAFCNFLTGKCAENGIIIKG